MSRSPAGVNRGYAKEPFPVASSRATPPAKGRIMTRLSWFEMDRTKTSQRSSGEMVGLPIATSIESELKIDLATEPDWAAAVESWSARTAPLSRDFLNMVVFRVRVALP